MFRRTKIVATLGPSTDDPAVLGRLLEAGVDVVRVNFSHGSSADRERRVAEVRRVAQEKGMDIAIMGDLQGPKIRIGRFRDGPVTLVEGQRFVLDADMPEDAGNGEAVSTGYERLPDDVGPGDLLLLDDGQLELRVEAVQGRRVICQVVTGGVLSNHKGINRQGGGLSAPALTDKDLQDIRTAARLGMDYLAVSFPRSAQDIERARGLLREAGGDALIVAKIERAEAIDCLDEIIDASDVVMIARGDLGVEVGFAGVPGIQKRILKMTRQRNKVAIIATQMMESMITQPLPTRAEVSDVANAVLDGADAVMLSAETAVGKRPVGAVRAMARICEDAERHQASRGVSSQRRDEHFHRIDEAIAMAVMYTANHLNVQAIVALTESGSTALWMSRVRSDIPIFAFTRHAATRRRVRMYRGVHPVAFDVVKANSLEVYQGAFRVLLDMGAAQTGDLVIFTKGDAKGVQGGTNAMKILRLVAD